LYALIEQFFNSQSERLHDKVFALNGLAKEETRIEVGYKENRYQLARKILDTIPTTSAIVNDKALNFLADVFGLSRTSSKGWGRRGKPTGGETG
jgi:hypothetical protein